VGRRAVVVVLALVVCAAGLSRLAWGGPPLRALTGEAHATRLTQALLSREVPSKVDPAAATDASLAYAAMRRRFAFVDGRYAASDTRHSSAHLWPLSQALTASLAFSSLPGRGAAAARAAVLRTVGALAQYRSGQGYESVPVPDRDRGGNLYYDDNNWIALDLLAAYRLSGTQGLLKRAEGVFQFLVSGWDTNADDACPGGVFWAKPPLRQIRTTVSTANAALVALRLYQATGSSSYLAWGRRMYAWVTRCLAGRNGLYFDHVDNVGNVSKHEWTYNQGAMIAAGVLLAKATGQRSYFDQARASAKVALARYGASGYKGEPPIFVAIFFSDLNLLQRVAQLPSYRAALRHYLRHVTLGSDGHFGSSLLSQAAAVQLYSLAAAPG
jgi:Glycosyl hydrolase family 76